MPDDRSQYRATVSACKILGFSTQEIETLWNVVGAILHLVSKFISYFNFNLLAIVKKYDIV